MIARINGMLGTILTINFTHEYVLQGTELLFPISNNLVNIVISIKRNCRMRYE